MEEINRDAAYEEVLPTDRWAIQDMFLMRIHRMGVKYQAIMLGYYRGGRDPRALSEFYALADEFYMFAFSNIAKHLKRKEVEELSAYFSRNNDQTPENARRIYELFQTFATNSKLTELSEKRWKGSFAYARRELGIGAKGVRE